MGSIIPVWWGWLTVVSSIISATSSIVSSRKSYYENLNSAKSFTIIKHKARSLHCSFSSFYNEQDLFKEVKNLSEYYNQLILLTPPTQEWAYKKAIKKLSIKNKKDN